MAEHGTRKGCHYYTTLGWPLPCSPSCARSKQNAQIRAEFYRFWWYTPERKPRDTKGLFLWPNSKQTYLLSIKAGMSTRTCSSKLSLRFQPSNLCCALHHTCAPSAKTPRISSAHASAGFICSWARVMQRLLQWTTGIRPTLLRGVLLNWSPDLKPPGR